MVVALAVIDPARAYLAAALAVAGSTIGNLALFEVARRGGRAYLDRMSKTGWAAKFRAWFDDYGIVSVFIPALSPIPMPLKIFVASAGALGVRPLVFASVILAARTVRYFGLAWMGTQLGNQTIPWLKSNAGFILAGLVLLAIASVFLLQRLRPRTTGSA